MAAAAGLSRHASRQRQPQIPIEPAAPAAPHLLRFCAWALFGRRPQPVIDTVTPISEKPAPDHPVRFGNFESAAEGTAVGMMSGPDCVSLAGVGAVLY